MDDNKFPQWAHGPDGQSGIFNSAEEIPAGWVDHPSKVKGAAPAGGGVETPIASANGVKSEKQVAKSTTAASQTATDPAKAAKSGVAGLGSTPATGDTAGLDAHGHPYDPAVHAGTGSKTKDGLWRMKVGVKRPAPAEGFPKVAPPLDL